MNDFERILSGLRSAQVSFVIIGGVAATVHGSARLTSDVDIVYERSLSNIERLVEALAPLKPYLRGAPAGLPFRFDVETVRRGLNFTLTTDAGPVDVLGEITGVGNYDAVLAVSEDVLLYESNYRCINLDALIVSKRAAGRPKDLEVVAELELIRDERSRLQDEKASIS
jgi:predicted nucleotidyltransferase